jgi:hypothetical protein
MTSVRACALRARIDLKALPLRESVAGLVIVQRTPAP